MRQPIGRHHECSSISVFLDALAEGRGGVLLVEGEGGTGKTTLAEWATVKATDRGFAALAGRSWEMSQSIPYEPIVAALGRFLRAQPTGLRDELTAGLSSLSTLIDGLDVATPLDGSGKVFRARLHDAVATLLARAAETQPVLLLIDDLHWCDVPTLELLHFICRDFPYVALGIVATVRPGDADDRPDVRSFIAPLRRASFCSSVTVRNLDRIETTALLAERLGEAPPERLVELVWTRSIGTPLLVHEMVEDLRSRDVLVRTDRGWEITDPDPPLPRVAADLIHGRIERAQPSERSLLEILAVADEPTGLDVLLAVSELTSSEIEERLGRLISNRLVTELTEASGAVAWHAEHPIIGHVVAADLDALVRQRLHRQLLAATPLAPVARRARHVVGGGPPVNAPDAIEILIAAGDAAFQQGASQQAVANYEAAIGFANELAPSDEVDEQLFRIHVGLGGALTRLRRANEGVEVLDLAWGYAVTHEGPRNQLDVLRLLDQCVFLSGGSNEVVLSRLERVAELFVKAADWDGSTEVHFFRYVTLGRNGRHSAQKELARSLDAIGGRSAGPRARLIIELLELNYQTSLPHPQHFETTIRRLVEVTSAEGDWDLRHRAGLMAIDLAGHLGRPELVDLAITRTRAVESEVGELPNWRIPVLRAIASVAEGQDGGDLLELTRVGELERSHGLVALIRGLQRRYSYGPDAALDLYKNLSPSKRPSDAVARVYEVLGRLIVGEGSSCEVELASAVLAQIPTGAATLFTVGFFDYAKVLATTIAGSPDAVETVKRGLHDSDGAKDLPAAWRALSDSRLASGSTARAEHLVRAAECFDACNYRLEAASRWVEAAEADRDAVDDDRLREAGLYAHSCGATWVAGRAAALIPGLETGDDSRPDDRLTKREWEVASQVARGLTNREVAQELFISIRTVTSHLDHIYTKLGFSSREALTSYVGDRPDNT